MTNDREALLQFSQAFCEELSNDDEGLKREISRMRATVGRWGIAYHGHPRAAAPRRDRPPISGRDAENADADAAPSRAGRVDIALRLSGKAARVVYTITDAGKEMLLNMLPLWSWIIASADAFRAARSRYDDQNEAPPRMNAGLPAPGGAQPPPR